MSDAYVLVRMLYATVLFLAGIVSKLPDQLEHPAIIAAGGTLIIGLVIMFANAVSQSGATL